MDVIRAMLGMGAGGAASLDGLAAMRSRQMSSALRRFPAGPSDARINSAIESALYSAGLPPHSEWGQSATALLNGLYGIAPGMVGGLIGLPDPSRMFGYYANGASGMDVAAGRRMTDVFNPYSVLESHRRAMELGRMTYGLATRRDGGYDIGFGHGLNMDEIGLVGQRLLSSRLPYVGYGKRPDGELELSMELGYGVDPGSSPDEFRNNLKQLGSKFNEAASMLSKVTGSVKEALRFMDEIAGGNFLGGTAKEASDVARRAMKVAAAYRMTAALSGEDPKAMFASSRNLASTMAAGMGVDPKLAKATGFEGALMDMSNNAMLTYGIWAAAHPDASPQERQLALAVASARTAAYSNSPAAALAASVTLHKGEFTPEELAGIKRSARDGDFKRHFKLIQERIGERRLAWEMSAVGRVATRIKASEADRDMLAELDSAGIQGNVVEAGKAGRTLFSEQSLRDALGNDADMEAAARKGGDEALRSALAGKFERKYLDGLNSSDLRSLANANMDSEDEVDDVYWRGALNAARDEIRGNTMSGAEESGIRKRLAGFVRKLDSITAEEKDRLIADINGGRDLDEVYGIVRARTGKDKDRLDELGKIRGGKLSRRQAGNSMRRIDEALDDHRKDTKEEKLAVLSERHKRDSVTRRQGLVNSYMSGLDYGKGTDGDILKSVVEKVRGAASEGRIFIGDDDEELSDTVARGAERMLDGIFGGRLGDLDESQYRHFTGEAARLLIAGVKEGKDVRQSFRDAILSLKGSHGSAMGEKGVEALDKLASEKGMPKDYKLGIKALLSGVTSVIGESDERSRNDRFKELYALANDPSGFGLDEAQAAERFASTLGMVTGIDAGKLLAAAKGSTWDETVEEMLELAAPGRVRGYANAAMGAGNNVGKALVALSDGRISLDFVREGIGLEGLYGLMSAMDSSVADAELNKLTNAFSSGDLDAYREAVAKGKYAQIEKLQGTLKGKSISEEEVEKAFSDDKDADKRREDLRRKLGDRDYRQVEILFGKDKIGGESGAGLLFSRESLERARNSKSFTAEMYELAKEENRRDNPMYGVADGIGSLLKLLSGGKVTVRIDDSQPIKVKESQ